METFIILLRGINVGGNNLIKMADLREIASDLGFENPRTLLQSGNLVVKADSRRDVSTDLKRALLERLNLNVEVLLRTASELAEIIQQNPFPEEASNDPSHLIVAFMLVPPSKDQVDQVQAAIAGPEKIKSFGNQVYVVYPIGIGDSKVAKTPGWNELMASGTARNWNTILKLEKLASH